MSETSSPVRKSPGKTRQTHPSPIPSGSFVLRSQFIFGDFKSTLQDPKDRPLSEMIQEGMQGQIDGS